MSNNESNNTMYDSIISNNQIATIYNNVVGELENKELDQNQIASALLAATSMGFNDLFNVLSRMIVNSDILNTYLNSNDIDDNNLKDCIIDTMRVINTIGKSINNDDIRSLTERLNTILAQQEVNDESPVNSEVDKDESEDLS